MAGRRLRDYWIRVGIPKGRRDNRIRGRGDFAQLAAATAGGGNVLELGPFYAPLLRGPEVRYADVLTTEELRARAVEVGGDPAGVPLIDFVVRPHDLSSIHESFRACMSSHVIEHQPDLVGHLIQVAQLLHPGGRYFLVVPDRRYCFDHFMPSSSLAEVIAAHREGRSTHILRSVIEHRALTVHNDPIRHWKGDHGDRHENSMARLEAAVAEFNSSSGYVDVHAWYFDPQSFRDLITELHALGIVPFSVETVYPTHRDSLEFWAVLTRC